MKRSIAAITVTMLYLYSPQVLAISSHVRTVQSTEMVVSPESSAPFIKRTQTLSLPFEVYDIHRTTNLPFHLCLAASSPSENYADWTVDSNQPGSRFGESVATAGDVNGDGYDDVVVGASFYNSGLTQQGAAFLYCGSPSGLGTSPAVPPALELDFSGGENV